MTESARLTGDSFNTRTILLTEAMATLPTVANLAMIQVDNLRGQMMSALNRLPGVAEILKAHPLHLPHEMESSLQAIHVLGHGFMLMGMLWGGFSGFSD